MVINKIGIWKKVIKKSLEGLSFNLKFNRAKNLLILLNFEKFEINFEFFIMGTSYFMNINLFMNIAALFY